jgi:SAM-dependent methyltransferase
VIRLHSRDHEGSLRNFIAEKTDLSKGDKVLDLCTGTGSVAVGLARQVGENGVVVGLDFSAGMLTKAKEKSKALNLDRLFLVLARAHLLPFKTLSFNGVTCSHAFYELKGEERDTAIQEVARVLKKGGRFCLMEHAKPQKAFFRILFYIRIFLLGARDARKFLAEEESIFGNHFVNIRKGMSPTGQSKLICGDRGDKGLKPSENGGAKDDLVFGRARRINLRPDSGGGVPVNRKTLFLSKPILFLEKRQRDWKVTVLRTSLDKLAYQMVFPYLSIYIVALGASVTELGIVNSLGMVAGGMVGPFTGWFIDRTGPKKIYLVGIGLLAISYLTYAIAQSWLITMIAMVAYWLGYSVSVHSCATVCGNCLTNEDRATGMMICETVAAGLLGMAGPMIGAWLVTIFGGVEASGIRPLFLIALMITVGTLYGPDSPTTVGEHQMGSSPTSFGTSIR